MSNTYEDCVTMLNRFGDALEDKGIPEYIERIDGARVPILKTKI
jgi:hypothetical protein